MESKKKIILLLTGFVFIFIGFVSADCSEGQVNINNASIEELDLIKWVGIATAQAIISSRPFSSVDDLISVSGIGETKLQDIKIQGLACVDTNETDSDEDDGDWDEEGGEDNDEEPKDPDEKDADRDNDPRETEIINYTLKTNYDSTKQKTENITLEKIKIANGPQNAHTKDIKTVSNYAFYGLGVFSILLITLMILKFKRYNKNEFT